MSFISILRVVVLNFCLMSGLVVVGINAHLTALTTASSLEDPTFFDFEGLGLVTGSLSTIAILTMLILGALQQNAFASMIAVELCVLGLIWALWLANGAVVANWIQVLYPFGCSDLLPSVVLICHEFHAIEGLSFASGILLVIYSGILLCFAMVGRSHGNRVWTVAVSQANFSAPPKEDIIGVGTQLPGNHIGSVANPYVVGSGPMYENQQFHYPPADAISSSGVPPTMGYMTQQAFIAPLAAGPQQRPPYPEV